MIKKNFYVLCCHHYCCVTFFISSNSVFFIFYESSDPFFVFFFQQTVNWPIKLGSKKLIVEIGKHDVNQNFTKGLVLLSKLIPFSDNKKNI